MKFTIDRNVYSGALDKVRKALKDDDETLKYIYHEVTSKWLRLVATDSDIQVEYIIPVGESLSVEEEGKSCPLGSKLSDLIKGYPNVSVVVHNETEVFEESDADAPGLDVTVEKFYLQAQKSDKRKIQHWVPCGYKVRFPLNDFKFTEEESVFKFSAKPFITALKKTQYSTAKTLQKPSLVHVCIDVDDNGFAAVSTDGFRMSYYIRKGSASGNGRILLQTPHVRQALGLLDDTNEIEVTDDKKIITLRQSQMKISCRQLEGVDYVDWRSRLAMEENIRASVSREELMQSVKNILHITDFACRMNFSQEDQQVRILVQPVKGNAVVGGSDESVPCVLDGDASFSVVPRFLLEALMNSSAETVTFVIAGDNQPFKLLLEDSFENIITTLNI